MNSFNGVGRLCTDPELRKTQTGKSVVSVTVACDERGKTEFIPCVFWEKSAEILKQYCTKGSRIGVEGVLTSRKYEDNNGNKRMAYEVRVRQLELLGDKKQPVADDFSGDFTEDADYDLPF